MMSMAIKNFKSDTEQEAVDARLRAPFNRKVIQVDVSNLTPKQQTQRINDWRARLRSKAPQA